MVNGIWYTIEGDGVNATISLTSAKYIGKIVKLADGSYSVVKFGGKSTKEFLENIQRIDLDADGLKQLNKDLADKEFAEAIVENPKLVDSWKVLDGAGVDDVVRRNIDELELVSKNIDEIKAFDGGYDAWKINRNAGGDVATLLAKYTNVRKYLDDGQIKAYLNTTDANTFTDLLRKGNPDILKQMDEMDVDDFGEMVRGYIDNPKAFENSLVDVDKFSGKYGWLSYWKLTPDIKYSINTIKELQKGGKLLPTGTATEIELSTLQAFTVKGDFVNIPMRYNKSYLGEYAERGFKHITNCLEKLREIPERLISNQRVFSGKTFSKADFESKFVGGTGKTIEYESFVSSSLNREVAEGFIELTAKHAGDGEKIAIIQRITTKKGVYIDDLSDWGENLGKIRHTDADEAIQIQKEVLTDAGSFRQTAEPIAIKNANGEHVKIGGFDAYYLDLIEL